MYVIRGTAATNTDGVPTTANSIFPADRCVWAQGSVGNPHDNYTLTEAILINGNGSAIVINNPVLGVIGKSGRFVGMTV